MKVPSSIGLLFALTLAACGGGGGGGDTGSTAAPTPVGAPASASGPAAPAVAAPVATAPAAPAAAPSNPGSPAPSPAPGSGADSGAGSGGTGSGPGNPGNASGPQFTSFGPIVVASAVTVTDAATDRPQIALLAGGGSVVVWRSGTALLAQQIDAAGNRVGPQQSIATSAKVYSVAGLYGGDWIVAWSASTLPAATARAHTYTVQTKRFSSAGNLVQDTTPVNTSAALTIDAGVAIAGTTDGGYALAWTYQAGTTGAPRQVLLQRYLTDGAAVGSVVTVSTVNGDQTRPRVVPLSNGAVQVAWLQGAGGGASGATSYSVYTRRFTAGAAAAGPERQVQPSTEASEFSFATAALTNDRIALVWAQPTPASTGPQQLRWQILDANGAGLSSAGGRDVGPGINSAEVAPAGTGFTGFVQVITGASRGSTAKISSLAVDANGAAAGALATALDDRGLSSIGAVTGSMTGPTANGFSVAGRSDGHYVLAYEHANPNGAQLEAFGR